MASSTTTSNQKSQSTQETKQSQKTQSTQKQQSSQQQQSSQKTQSSQKQQSTSLSKQQQSQQSVSTTQAMLNEALRDTILSGLKGYMTDDEITAFAENLLKPALNAELEAAQQSYDASKLGYEQEIENLAVQLNDAINKQNASYTQNVAQLENAALARGMGRSSYLLDTEAQLGQALSETIRQLTNENARQSAQIQNKITLAGQQAAQTQGRLQTDYASQLAAKVQELRENQRQEYNQNYMSAISAALGSQTTGNSQSTGLTNTTGTNISTGMETTQGTANTTGTVDTVGTDLTEALTSVLGTDTTDSTSTTTTDSGGGSGGGGGGGSGSSKKTSQTLYTGVIGDNSNADQKLKGGGGATAYQPLSGKKMYVN